MNNRREIVLHGRTPSKKNSRRVLLVRGRILYAPSKDYEQWRHDNLLMLKIQKIQPISDIDHVHIKIYPPTRRAADATNKAESVMDILVDAGIIEDDNWYIVPKVICEFIEVDKSNPRAEVIIEGICNQTEEKS